MTKIYNAKTFLEADQIIATLQSQHISAEKREISDMNVITGKMETAFEIYVSEEDAENAVKCIEQIIQRGSPYNQCVKELTINRS